MAKIDVDSRSVWFQDRTEGCLDDSVIVRHSLANVDVGSRLSKNGRRTSIPGFRGSLTAAEAATKQELLERVQEAVIQLFQRRKLKENDLGELQDSVRKLADTEAGPLLYDYYKDQLLKKGMVILREIIKNERGKELLDKISEIWEFFFTDILPTLQAMLYPLSLPSDMSVRDVSLMEFRNIVLLKVSFEEAIKNADGPLPDRILQMMLVLQSVSEGCWLSENYHRMEKLLAQVVVPYLGVRGLYMGNPEPTLKAASRLLPKVLITEHSSPEEEDTEEEAPILPASILNFKRSGGRHSHLLSLNHRLAPVLEQDSGRRHSLLS